MSPLRTLSLAALLTMSNVALAQGADAAALAEARPTDPDAAFNAGLAAAHADSLGWATLWLERAHRLAPLDREIEDALQAVRREARRVRAEESATRSYVEGEAPALYWWRFLAPFQPARCGLGFLVLSTLASLLIGAGLRADRRAVRETLVALGVAAFALAGLTGAAWVARVQLEARVVPAVVVAEAPRARSAPDDLATARRLPELYSGAVVTVVERRGSHTHVALVSGQTVWVPSTDVALIDLSAAR